MIQPLDTVNAKPHSAHEGNHRRRAHRLETQIDVPPTCHSKSVLPALRKQPAEKYLSRYFVQVNEEIDVSRFKDIQIRFPGDAYILAVWLAMSDRSKSTPTCQPHTTLHGLARNMAILHGTDPTNPLTAEAVMTVFRQHGITGNPLLRLEETADELLLPERRIGVEPQ